MLRIEFRQPYCKKKMEPVNVFTAMSITMVLFLQIFVIVIRCEKINEPTVKPVEPFSSSADAKILKEQLGNRGTDVDRDKIAKLWFHRSFQQRKEIESFYNENLCSLYQIYFPRTGTYSWVYETGCLLDSGFASNSMDSMQKLYGFSLLSYEAILAETLAETITDKWKEEGAIEEIVCANDKEAKDAINQIYQTKNKDTVENHLGTFRREDKDYQHAMLEYCWKGLCQDKKIKPEDAEKEAKALRDIDPEKNKEDFKKKLNELLDKNCEPDVKMIFEKYRQDKNGISDAVDKAFDAGRVKTVYNRLVRYIENTCQFYADELHEAVDGLGTDNDKIIRIILTRCERDLGCILNKYKDKHGKTFTNRLKRDTLSEPRYLTSIRYLCGKS